MADEYNRGAADRTLDRMAFQHKQDHKKGDSRTDHQRMKEQITDIAKKATRDINDAARKKEGGGQSFYMGGESVHH